MSIISDVPYYGARMQSSSPSPFQARAGGGAFGVDEPLLDHRIANMGIYNDNSDTSSIPTSPGGMMYARGMPSHHEADSYAAFEVGMGMPLLPFHRAPSASSSTPTSAASSSRHLSHHIVETRRALDHHHFAHDALVSPFGATLSEDPTTGSYVIEAPTPGIPKERLVLEAVGLRKLELTISSAPEVPSNGEGQEMGPQAEEEKEEEEEQAELEQGSTTASPPNLSRRQSRAINHRGATPALRHREQAIAAAMKRSVTLPHDCDLSGATTSYENGVLRVTVPRAPASSLVPGYGAIGAAHAGLLAAAAESKEKVNSARAELRALEAAAKEADRELRSALEETHRSQERVALSI
jgi:hypothetical protein